MAAIRDLLAGEAADAARATQAALTGRSQTGLSGHHEEIQQPIRGALPAAPKPIQRGGDAPAPERLRQPEMPPNREPFGDAELQLAFPARPGFRNYWFNDTPGRIARAKRAGYAHVIDPETQEPVCRVVDTVDGKGRNGYLMEIPIEWYQADMGASAERLERRLNDIRNGRAGPGAEDNRYIPRQGITIKGR
jgi:hypothetical protein